MQSSKITDKHLRISNLPGGCKRKVSGECVRHALQATFSRNQSYRLEPVAI
jgi:hypothetical protein